MQYFDTNSVGSDLEKTASAVVYNHLIALAFPLKRINFSVHFDYELTDFAGHKLDVVFQSRGVKGKVCLFINGLYLYKYTGKYLEDCIPHELAHMLHELECVGNDHVPDTKHGMDWQRWLTKIHDGASIQTNFDKEFDRRAVILSKGGFCCRCQCKGDNGFSVVSRTRRNINRVKEGAMTCLTCESHSYMVTQDEIPAFITEEMNFIQAKQRLQAGVDK